MLGQSPGWVPNPMEILVPHLQAAGYECLVTSRIVNRYARLMDIIHTLIRQRARIDVVCLQVYGGPSFVVEEVASWLGTRLGHRIVMMLHGGALPSFMRRYPRWSRQVLRRSHLLITPSAYLAHAVARMNLHAEIIPNIINLDEYPFQHRCAVRPRLLWMRTFHEHYNPGMAVRVLAGLIKSHPNATLTMAGQEKGLLEATQRTVERLGLSTSVRFAGFLGMNEKRREFPAHDVFLSTNHIDNMPISILEAAAFGLPIVATSVGGVPFLIKHEQDGLLVGDDDVAGMTESVERLLQNDSLVARLSANGRRLAERSDPQVVVPLWKHAFERVME
jgi:glycosyltransferase involved in cell wall biosynthesis